MSFHISFAARSASEARTKLHLAHAPAVIKALIEKALDAIPAPKPAAPTNLVPNLVTAVISRGGDAPTISGQSAKEPYNPHFGVLVECWGHIADAGDGGQSEIQRFLVRPLVG